MAGGTTMYNYLKLPDDFTEMTYESGEQCRAGQSNQIVIGAIVDTLMQVNLGAFLLTGAGTRAPQAKSTLFNQQIVRSISEPQQEYVNTVDELDRQYKEGTIDGSQFFYGEKRQQNTYQQAKGFKSYQDYANSMRKG